jgi:hypothetical protein
MIDRDIKAIFSPAPKFERGVLPHGTHPADGSTLRGIPGSAEGAPLPGDDGGVPRLLNV